MGLFIFILGIIFFIIGLVILIGGGENRDHGSIRGFSAIPLILSFLFILLSCLTTVPAKDDGVVVTFGSVGRTLDSGVHFKAPWSKVVDIDGTIQIDKYHGSKDTDHSSACIQVQIGDGSTTCMSVTSRWRVNPDKTNEVYKNYRSNNPTDHLRDAVVSTELLAAAQDVAGTYNPVNTLKVVDPNDTTTNVNFKPDLEAMSKALTDDMRKRVNGLVIIDSITISFLPTPASTQAKISAFTAEVANTRTQAQKKLSKEEEAKGNEALAASVSHDPNVLISKCLDMVAEGKVNLPPNFQCFPGGGAQAVFPVK